MKRLGLKLLLLALLLALSSTVGAQTGEPYEVRAYIQPDQEITDQQTVHLVVEIEGRWPWQLPSKET